jgi:adenylate cyclase
MQRSYYQQMPLIPLGPEAITELLRDLLGTDLSLAGLADRIRDRTGGNPFFIEEVVQALTEAGSLEGSSGAYRLVKPVDEVAIPAKVQSVLAARIDRLGEREKQVLQTASVIGRSFSEPVLKALAELPDTDLAASLSSLQRSEFIYEQALYPEAVYVFKHALTQEVAYRSQLTERRAHVHGAVARTIANLYPERLDEQAALIAHHWEEAWEALEAVRWHSRAAQWAGTSHLAEALGHWRKVRELLERVPESEETVALGVAARIQILAAAWRLGVSEEEAAVAFAEGKALAERSGDLRGLAHLSTTYAAARGLGGDVEAYLYHSTEAARVADQTDDDGLKVGCRSTQAVALWFAGRLPEAVKVAEQMLARTPDDPKLGADIFGFCPYIGAVWFRGWMVSHMGRSDEAEADLDRGLELARQHGDTENLGWVHTAYVELVANTGRAEAALGHARDAVEIAAKIGSPFSRVWAYEALGIAHILTDEWSNAVEALERALEIARDTHADLADEPSVLAYLAQAYLGLGDDSRAHETADEAVAVARRRGTKYFECAAHLARARVLLLTEGTTASDDIRAALSQAQTLVEETGGRSQQPFIHEAQANLARLTGDDATCQRELREAHRLFTEMGATGHAERLAKELGL